MATQKDFFVKAGAQASSTLIAGVGVTNQAQINGAASGSPVTITAIGGDPNIGINLVTKGTGGFLINGSPFTATPGGTNGQIQFNNSGTLGGYPVTGTAGSVVLSNAPTLAGGSISALTLLSLANAGTGAFNMTLAHSGTMTAARTLTLNVVDAARSITLAGNISTANDLNTSGNFPLTLTTTASSNVTFPTTGILATTGNTETLSNKTLSNPTINTPALSWTTLVAGTNAQGQGAITVDLVEVTTAPNNPSGVTLPSTVSGRVITLVNRGANPVALFPATGHQIDFLAANTAITVPVNGWVQVVGISGTLWFSTQNSTTNGSSVVGNISGAAGSLTPGATINGTNFTGASGITITANTPNALTFNNSGTGAASGTTFNGSAAQTISFNSIGAPSTTGTNASGTWAINVSGTAGSTGAITVTADTATATSQFLVFTPSTAGANSPKASTALTFVASTGTLGATVFSGAGTGLTGTASSLSIGGNAATATTATTANATAQAVTFNNSNTGAGSGTTFNGSSAITVSANTIGAVPLAGGTMTGFLTLSADPTQALHAATKQYVDAIASSLDIKASVRAATTAALTATYTNGTAGVGATLTNSGTLAALVLDGVTMVANDRVLIKDQASTFQNGIYAVTNIGSGAVAWVLTRTTDADQAAEITPGMFTFVEEGTANGKDGYVLTSTGATTVGTTGLPFTQFSGAGTYLAGNGMVLVGGTFHFAQSGAYTVGDLHYATSGSAIGTLTAVATGNALISGGAAAAPAWGKIGLTTHVTGTLTVGNGGIGVATLSGIAFGNGTSAFTAATGAQISTALGSTNISGNAANVTGTVAVGNGGTGTTTAPTQWGMIYSASASAYASTAAGTSGQAMVSNGAAAPSFQTLNLSNLPDAWIKRACKVATTAQQALSGGSAFPTIDGVVTASGDRVLLRNQAAPAENGIYVVGGISTAWTLTRAADANTTSFMAEAMTSVDSGTANGGRTFCTNFKLTDTLGTTAMAWFENINVSHIGNASYIPSPTGTGASGTWAISISGLAATATSATNSANVFMTTDASTNAGFGVLFGNASNANGGVSISAAKLAFNPSTGVLTASGGFSGNATTASFAGGLTTVTNDTTTNSTWFPTFVSTGTNAGVITSTTKLTWNPGTGVFTAPTFSGNLSGTATSAISTTNIAVTDDGTTNATYYPVFATTNSGNVPVKVSSGKLNFNPSTGVFSSQGNIVSLAALVCQTELVLSSSVHVAPTATAGVSVTTTTATTIDTFATTTYRSARYAVQIADGTNYEMLELMVLHDGTTAYITVFGNLFNSASTLGSFDATISAGTLTLTYSAATATSKVIRFLRTTFIV